MIRKLTTKLKCALIDMTTASRPNHYAILCDSEVHKFSNALCKNTAGKAS